MKIASFAFRSKDCRWRALKTITSSVSSENESITCDAISIHIPTLIGYTRECLALRVGYNLKAHNVLDVLSDVFISRGLPDYIRSDNGSEFKAKMLQDWLKQLDVKTAFIAPGSPWENGYNESFNGRFRDEFLNEETGDVRLTQTFLCLLTTSNLKQQVARSRHQQMSVSNL